MSFWLKRVSTSLSSSPGCKPPCPLALGKTLNPIFRAEHALLRVTSVGTLGESKVHQENLVHQVLNEVHQLLLQDPAPSTPTLPALPSLEAVQAPPPVHMANAAQQHTDILPTLLAQMSQMQSAMLTMQRQLATQQQQAPPAPAPRRPRRRGTKYCWTHGLGKHDDTSYENKVQGYQDTVIKDNRMGGSNRGCNSEWWCWTDTSSFKINNFVNSMSLPNTLSVVPPKIIAKADSGATNHYFIKIDSKTLQ